MSAIGAGPVEPPRRRHWFYWVGWLLALLVLLLLLSFLRQCTPASRGWWGDEDSLADGLAEEARLRRQLSRLRINLDQARLDCGDCGNGGDLSSVDPPGIGRLPEGAGGAIPGPAPMDPAEFCQRMARELGECNPGSVSVSLGWDAFHDLDLGVETPGGDIIYHKAREGSSGGGLILDYNVEPGQRIDKPVESVSWAGAPPPGRYRVMVKLHDIDPRNDTDPVAFTVRITIGETTKTVTGLIAFADVGHWRFVDEFIVD
jgi:hypothetical protein